MRLIVAVDCDMFFIVMLLALVTHTCGLATVIVYFSGEVVVLTRDPYAVFLREGTPRNYCGVAAIADGVSLHRHIEQVCGIA